MKGKSKFFATKLYIITRMDGVIKMLRNKHDALDYCDENGIDYGSCVMEFDSKKEYDRYLALRRMEEQGVIHDLKRQVEFLLTPAYYEDRIVGTKRKRAYIVNGITFHRKSDASEYCREHNMPRKEIVNTLVSEQVVKNVCIESKSVYTADFTYTLNNGEKVVEDVKSSYTKKETDYVLRRKMMLDKYGIKIKEYD